MEAIGKIEKPKESQELINSLKERLSQLTENNKRLNDLVKRVKDHSVLDRPQEGSLEDRKEAPNSFLDVTKDLLNSLCCAIEDDASLIAELESIF